MEPMQTNKVPSNVQEIPGRGETFQVARERLATAAHEAAHYADQRVRGHPWTSVGVGFGAGVVIGALIVLAAVRQRDY